MFYALIKHTLDGAEVIAISQSRTALLNNLKEEAKEHALSLCDNDYAAYNEYYKYSIEHTICEWCDDDEQYPCTFKIQEVEVI